MVFLAVGVYFEIAALISRDQQTLSKAYEMTAQIERVLLSLSCYRCFTEKEKTRSPSFCGRGFRCLAAVGFKGQ